jgi:DNA-binding response OmpR family regulator
MHVLYVDDDLAMTMSVGLMLRRAGHSCDKAELGERAVELANENHYDAIILDIMLPDIDGYEVIERLREAQVSTPLLLQTGLVDRAEPGDAEAFGVDDILIKPFDKQELIDHLEKVTSRPDPAPAEPAEAPEAEAPEAEAPEDEAADRHQGRVKAFITCEIEYGDETHRVMVLSHSGSGAVVRLPSHLTDCPKNFTLNYPTGESCKCRICWRAHDKIGVAFL